MKILIGIPAYQNVSAETLEDYMRFAFYCGRRTDHEFMIGIKSKSEQFRARNAIVEGALQTGCDYLMFLDDDHVIDWETTSGPNSRYGMIETFLQHFDNDPELGIVGALYYHRGGDCRAVVMREGEQGGYYWLRDDEILGKYQEVDVQGGGCMMLRMSIFDKISSPWFEPEFDLGTDIQICKKAKDAGFKVACDTSITIGHVLSKREVVTADNRHKIEVDSGQISQGITEGMNRQWSKNSALALYRQDAEEYLGIGYVEICEMAGQYSMSDFNEYENKSDYYAAKGKEQLARQVAYHHLQQTQTEMEYFQTLINSNNTSYGADYGCGSSPVGFEFAMRGHKMDFIDVDGAGAYEFTKWRAKKRGIDCGFELKGPYDYILLLDAIEHLQYWEEDLERIISALRPGGGLVTNFFRTMDFTNREHISMDHKAVNAFLTERGVYPHNDFLYVKREIEIPEEEKVA